MLSHRVIFHGRRVCHARKPACGVCMLAADCPSFGTGPTDPALAAALVKGPSRARLLRLAGAPDDGPADPHPRTTRAAGRRRGPGRSRRGRAVTTSVPPHRPGRPAGRWLVHHLPRGEWSCRALHSTRGGPRRRAAAQGARGATRRRIGWCAVRATRAEVVSTAVVLALAVLGIVALWPRSEPRSRRRPPRRHGRRPRPPASRGRPRALPDGELARPPPVPCHGVPRPASAHPAPSTSAPRSPDVPPCSTSGRRGASPAVPSCRRWPSTRRDPARSRCSGWTSATTRGRRWRCCARSG